MLSKYSQELDFEAYVNRIWKDGSVDYNDNGKDFFYRFMPKDFIDDLMSAPDIESAHEVVKKYWQRTLSPSFDRDNDFLIKWFERLLNEEKENIIAWLEKAYAQPFPYDEITVYITICFFSPYNYDKLYFMVNRNSNFFGILNTSRHELNHFMFYHYHRDYLQERGVSNESIEFMKEAMAILTSGKKTENEGRSAQILRMEDFIK